MKTLFAPRGLLAAAFLSAALAAASLRAADGPNLTASDLRFTTKGDLLYAVILGRPEGGKVTIKALASKSAHYPGEIGSIQMLGSPAKLEFAGEENALTVTVSGNGTSIFANALKVIPKA
ncbi:MAG: alpha-L-fucosidase C-terminal domain-containing protein [Verrucomicrobiota bacterium]|jgi:alpha-L-fucosidase